jgi:hypothetical protein
VSVLTIVLVVAVLVVCGLALSVRIVQQYERGCCSGWDGSTGSGSPACG